MRYPGGKNGSGVPQTLINQMPPHKVYIEGFFGGGAVIRWKRPAEINIGIDLSLAALELWQRHHVEVPNLTLLNANTLDWLEAVPVDLNDPRTLLYLDPPYLFSTRSTQAPIYEHEMTDDDHLRLLEIIKGMGCMVMISGYYSDIYANYLEGWRTITFTSQTRGGRTATEWLWMNYSEPMKLHDYRYLGDTFRERARIKKQQRRWKRRLLGMPELERRALMTELLEAVEGG